MNYPETATKREDEGRFEVFFDGDCPLCKREIDMIRRKDKHHRLQLTDIAAADFDPGDLSLDTLMRQIHGRFPDGQFVTGVDVFREIYQRIGFGRLVKTSRWPLIKQALNLGYVVFAKVRFFFAMRRLKNRNLSCDLSGDDSVSGCKQLP